MDTHSSRFKVRLGLFVAGGLLLFAVGIFLIGRQRQLFDSVFKLTSRFNNVSGLQVGNNVRFSGINVGTVENIRIINDSTVQVDMVIRKNVQPFIKTDCKATIGSEGIIGDKVLGITHGSSDASSVKDGQFLLAVEPIEPEAIIKSLHVTALNAEIISSQLASIMLRINKGNGTLGRLIRDSTISENINQTIINLKKSSKGLDENMKAAKSNFLLKGYFDNKKKKAEKEKKNAIKAKEEKANQK